jgi:hypothetical protein
MNTIKKLQNLIKSTEIELNGFRELLKEEEKKVKNERKWKIHEIIKQEKGYLEGDRKKVLYIVAKYCNDMDELTYEIAECGTFNDLGHAKKYYPIWNPLTNKIEISCTYLIYITPYFNSKETLLRLIEENNTFFINLLNPKSIIIENLVL